MKGLLICALLLVTSFAIRAEDEAALKEQMHKACSKLFDAGGACADLAKGTRKCTRAHLADAGPECADFEKSHKDFFDAGMKDEMIRK